MMGIWEIMREWLMAGDSRKVEFSHGGEGGKWYALIRDDDNNNADGTGDTANEALESAWAAYLATN